MEMTADLQEKDQHILKSTSMKLQENPADFSSVHKVQAFFAQICCQVTPCISRFSHATFCVCTEMALASEGGAVLPVPAAQKRVNGSSL